MGRGLTDTRQMAAHGRKPAIALNNVLAAIGVVLTIGGFSLSDGHVPTADLAGSDILG